MKDQKFIAVVFYKSSRSNRGVALR